MIKTENNYLVQERKIIRKMFKTNKFKIFKIFLILIEIFKKFKIFHNKILNQTITEASRWDFFVEFLRFSIKLIGERKYRWIRAIRLSANRTEILSGWTCTPLGNWRLFISTWILRFEISYWRSLKIFYSFANFWYLFYTNF